MAQKSQIQKDYEDLDFPPGSNPAEILKVLAEKHGITLEDLLSQIDL